VAEPAIFLDRDGVIIESVRNPSAPPEMLDDLRVPIGVADALARLRANGFALVVVTNQPQVARGTLTRAAVEEINDAIRQTLPVDAIYVCFHDGAQCECRKPRPGLLLDAAHDLELDLSRSWLVGDRWVDIAAGASAGVRTVLLGRDWSWAPTSAGAPSPELAPDYTVANLSDAAAVVLADGAPATD
jgi:D-glycero-D-manno-heptose 1,7-bisphosphate phosphatase